MEREAFYETRLAWLEERGLSVTDILVDEDGLEYVMVQNESDHSDTYQVDFDKVDLPTELQTYNAPPDNVLDSGFAIGGKEMFTQEQARRAELTEEERKKEDDNHYKSEGLSTLG